MGIIYKLKKHKDLKMDLNKDTNKQYRKVLLEENMKLRNSDDDGEDDECDASAMKSDEMQFTAEHILQLCKFLAEKSRKNKTLYKEQQSVLNRKSTMTPYDTDDSLSLPLLPNTHINTNDLTENSIEYTTNNILQPNTNNPAFVIHSNVPTTCSQQYHQHHHQQLQHQQQQQNQGKRDILLKIRHQIFERKRQRQLAHMQQRFGVWRPW